MKIEYFDLFKKEQPILLIHGNEPENIRTLRKAVHDLAIEERSRVVVHELPGFESVDGCKLIFTAKSYDRGVKLIIPPKTFECSIRPLWWHNIEGLLEPFCEPGQGTFNDLDYGFSSEIRLIISTDGKW